MYSYEARFIVSKMRKNLSASVNVVEPPSGLEVCYSLANVAADSNRTDIFIL